MRSAVVQNGVVTRVLVGSEPGAIECSKECAPGWLYENGAFSPPPRPEPPAATAQDVRAEAAARLRATDWYVVRAADPGDSTPVPQAILDYRAAVRAASNAMEADPPSDYADDSRWPEAVS